MTALPAGARPLSEPHPLLALEKNNLRADAQLTRDGHEHRRRIPIIAIDGLPALACSISTAQPNAGDTYRATAKAPAESISPVKADEAAPVEQIAPALTRGRINA